MGQRPWILIYQISIFNRRQINNFLCFKSNGFNLTLKVLNLELLKQPEMSSCAGSDLKKDQSYSNISLTSYFSFIDRKMVWDFLLVHYFKCLFKYTQIGIWAPRLIKILFNEVWSGCTIVPSGGLIIWQWYGTFNASGNFASRGFYIW